MGDVKKNNNQIEDILCWKGSYEVRYAKAVLPQRRTTCKFVFLGNVARKPGWKKPIKIEDIGLQTKLIK